MSTSGSEPAHPHLALEEELAYFREHRERWLREGLEGQWAAIKGKSVLGFYSSMTDAYTAGVGSLGSVPFLVKEVRRDDPIATVQRANLRKRA
jgi:hypothetical protein